MNTNSVFKVIDGPSLDRVFDSMKLFPEVIVPLEFKVIEVSNSTGANILETRDIIVDKVFRVTGSGREFDFSGSLEVKMDGIYLPRRFDIEGYNPKTRKGDFCLKKFFESQA